MVTNSLAVNELKALASRLEEAEKEAERGIEEAQAAVAAAEVQRDKVRADREHVLKTLELLGAHSEDPVGKLAREWGARLQGLSVSQCIMRIAEERGGVLEPRIAAEIILATGHWGGKAKNVNPVIYSHIRESGRFEKVEQGRYRLIRKASVGQTQIGLPTNDGAA